MSRKRSLPLGVALAAIVAAGCVIVVDEAGDIVAIRPSVTAVPPPAPVANMVVVPSVVGQVLQIAEANLAQSQLGIADINYRQSASPAGTVLLQAPFGGAIARAGSGVTLTLATPGVQARVPSVVGKNIVGATFTLRLTGLRLGNVSYQNVPGAVAGRVTSQSPLPGTSSAAGSRVNLVIHNPGAKLSVPSVTGQAYIEARRAIRDAGLVPSGVSWAASATVPRGRVASQSPHASAQVDPGAKVSLVLSSGSGLIAVPGVVGKVGAAAIAELARSGLRSTVQYKPVAGMPGRVIAQNPTAGQMVNRGTLVGLEVSKGLLTLARVAVPNVTGRLRGVANALLAAAGLKPGAVTYGPGTPGRVVSQNPSAGTNVARGTAVSFVLGRLIGPRPPVAARAAVPNIVGKTQGAASAALRVAGLTVGRVTKPAGLPGKVVSQSPVAGARVARGTAVSFVLGRLVGPRPPVAARATVPNVVGKTQGAAGAVLRVAGLTVGRVTKPAGLPGKVVSQSPAAGTRVARGTAVSFVLGRLVGPRPPVAARATVPNIVGKTQGAASAVLRAAGLTVGKVTRPPGLPGKVVSQSPAAGTRVARGTAVSIVLGRLVGPRPLVPPGRGVAGRVAVPNVVGKTQGAASAVLRAAGLTVGKVTRPPGLPGKVVSQSPAAGTRVARGTAVSIVLGRLVGPKPPRTSTPPARTPTPPAPTRPSRPAAPVRRTTVPNVVGMHMLQASLWLAKSGLAPGAVSYSKGPGKKGSVVSQSPAAGTQVARGTKVSLVVKQ